MAQIHSLIDDLRSSLPTVFTRRRASEALGGALAPRTLSNLDSAGEGPCAAYKIGRACVYERESFLLWLELRLQRAEDREAFRRAGVLARRQRHQ